MLTTHYTFRILIGIYLCATVACSPMALVDVDPPGSVVDPSVIQTRAGATQLYNAAITRFAIVYAGTSTPSFTGVAFGADNYVIASALFTDELMRVQSAVGDEAGIWGRLDERHLTSSPTTAGGLIVANLYTRLHWPRVAAQQAREALQLYAPDSPPAWQGRLFALEGYSLLWFAELFCSGIPLTSVPLVGSQAYTAGFATQELLERAILLFDSATALSADSARFLNLARVGKGRALLGLGRFADAANAVRDVPDDFVYRAEFHTGMSFMNTIGNRAQNVQVADGEGGSGLVWSTDPRTAIVSTPSISGAMRVSAKYSVTVAGTLDATVSAPTTPVRVADGLEARLIEAEAALAVGNPIWLTILNGLRATCIGAAACAPVPGLTSMSLTPLEDPGSANARVDLLMRERAMWLYLTGHRQGDLRRLAKHYGRSTATLYPTGTYENAGFPPLIPPASTNGTAYGPHVVLLSPSSEPVSNPLYSGCFDLNP